MFGSLKATKKASVCNPTAKTAPITASRTRPRTRDRSVGAENASNARAETAERLRLPEGASDGGDVDEMPVHRGGRSHARADEMSAREMPLTSFEVAV